MKTERLAAAIQRDLLRPTEAKPETPTCFACGRAMVERHNVDDDNVARFCSKRCRAAYDNGTPAYERERNTAVAWRVVAGPPGTEIGAVYTFGTTLIQCAGCGQSFRSKGRRCCSVECERQARERRENKAIMAELDMERPVKRKCEECGGDIPNWRKGRRVSQAARFCSPRCRRRARKAGKAVSPETDA
jgi:hypothetical protein